MVLSKTRRNLLRGGEIAIRMAEILEAPQSIGSELKENLAAEFQKLKEELEHMGFTVTWNVKFLTSKVDPLESKIHAEVIVLIPHSPTIH